ncbi:class I adenylate-forming enzyme family protein [Undibacterium sp. TJN25]|uniref:class I adenylate-forming enzyme family protein n=1 Tax=Undibacterium sp. TJN25 TaxID=3413056 RepID=UPI003BF00D9D
MINRLLQLAATQPLSPFIFHEESAWTFAEAADLAQRGASWLAKLGVQPGDKVVVAVSNRPLFLFYWFSALARGATAIPVSHELFGDALHYIVTQSEASVVLTEGAELKRIRLDLASLPLRVEGHESEQAFAQQMSALPQAAPAVLGNDFLAAILYTSGTTGQPKGTLIPNRSYLATGKKITEAIGITSRDRILTFLPLHHANPQMYAVLSALTVGCSVILVPRFSASGFLEQAARYQATGFTYVGTVLNILAKTIVQPAATSLRWCVGGGAPTDIWTALHARLSLDIFELYGMTETGGMVTMNTATHTRVGSVGVARDDFEVAILGPEDQLLPPENSGEIAVRPKVPFVMTTGYFRKPQETLDAMRNLWFHTGDLGHMDKDGFLYFERRKKELIRRGGEMISPVEIELAALKHAGIVDCAAVGVSDPMLDEEIKLVIVMRGKLDADEVVSFLRTVLEKHKIPRYIEFADHIPKTATQKVQRFKLTSNSDLTIDTKAAKSICAP